MERGFPRLERGFPRLERGFPRLERGFPRLERGFPRLERGFPKLECGFPRLERGFPRLERAFSDPFWGGRMPILKGKRVPKGPPGERRGKSHLDQPERACAAERMTASPQHGRTESPLFDLRKLFFAFLRKMLNLIPGASGGDRERLASLPPSPGRMPLPPAQNGPPSRSHPIRPC